MAKIRVIHKEGKKPLKFQVGGLHKTTHTPMDEKIPERKIHAAMTGKYGKEGKQEVNFMKNVLVGHG